MATQSRQAFSEGHMTAKEVVQ